MNLQLKLSTTVMIMEEHLSITNWKFKLIIVEKVLFIGKKYVETQYVNYFYQSNQGWT